LTRFLAIRTDLPDGLICRRLVREVDLQMEQITPCARQGQGLIFPLQATSYTKLLALFAAGGTIDASFNWSPLDDQHRRRNHAHFNDCPLRCSIARRQRCCNCPARWNTARAGGLFARCLALLPEGSRQRQRRATMPSDEARQPESELQKGLRKPRHVNR
jgi:hypothetical protein